MYHTRMGRNLLTPNVDPWQVNPTTAPQDPVVLIGNPVAPGTAATEDEAALQVPKLGWQPVPQ